MVEKVSKWVFHLKTNLWVVGTWSQDILQYLFSEIAKKKKNVIRL